MYVWMQYADMGQIAHFDEKSLTFAINPKVEEHVKGLVGEDREKIVSFIFKGVVEGLVYLHDTKNMANRDIKPDNILFATKANGTNNTHEDRAQIADFTTVVECTSPDYQVSG